MGGSLAKLGFGKETTYGTAVAVTKTLEFISEDIKGNYTRTMAEALSSSYVDRSDRFAVTNKGAAGSISMEPTTKGFGDLLAFMQGSVTTTGPVETAAYSHAATIGTLAGKMLTVQVLRPDENDVLQPWTYEGGKVTGFEFGNQIDQTLRCTLNMDFEKESNPDAPAGVYAATALQALTLPTGSNIFNWQQGSITIGGSSVEIAELSISVDNALNTDRYFIGSTSIKSEPKQDGKRQIEWSFRTPYTNNNFWEKVSSATVAGSYATLSATWTGLVSIPGTTSPLYPCITLDIPVARFDEGGPNVEGPSMLEQSFSGKGLYDGTTSALTITYKTQDATVLT